MLQLLCACSVQKRRYLPGYTLHWKQPAPRPAATRIPAAQPSVPGKTKAEAALAKDACPHKADSICALLTPAPPAQPVLHKKNLAKAGGPAARPAPEQRRALAAPAREDEPGGERVLATAILAFVFSFLTMSAFLVAIYMAFIGNYIFMVLLIALGIVLLPIVMILSVVAIVKKILNPEKYTGVWMAIFALTICIAFIGIWLLTII